MPLAPAKSRNRTPAVRDSPIDLRPEIQPRARVRRRMEPLLPPAAQAPATQAQPDSHQPTPKRDYTVGYGKPPKHGQFKKGKSGNPKGRPKGAKGLKTMVRSILTEKVIVRTSGGSKRMTRMEAMLHKIAEKAFAGDLRALTSLIQLYQVSVPEEPIRMPNRETPVEDQDTHDIAILAALRQSIRDEDDEE